MLNKFTRVVFSAMAALKICRSIFWLQSNPKGERQGCLSSKTVSKCSLATSKLRFLDCFCLALTKNTYRVKVFLIILFINSNTAIAEMLPVLSGVGGNFSAIANGEEVEFNEYKGKVVVVAFGYTNCADICPLTLGYYKRLYKALSAEEQQATKMLFVTVDPKYDTAKHLTKFVRHFHKDFIGVTGTREQIDTIVSLFQAEYNKLSTGEVATNKIRRITEKEAPDDEVEDTAYLYSHTVSLYLVDKDGDTRALQYTGTPIEEFADKIRTLINE